MALSNTSRIDGCTNSKSIAIYSAFSDIPSSSLVLPSSFCI